MLKEVCVGNFAEALKAQDLGANRIELCENLAIGGTTPSFGTIKICKKYLSIPVIVMIRPRGGDFVYTNEEIEIMLHDIKKCHEAGANGIAVGVLTREGKIDFEKLHRIIDAAGHMQITFHKAIDETKDILEEFQRLKNSGINRLLTSGGAPTASEGADTLNKIIKLAEDKIKIVAAGNITKDNLYELSKLIQTDEFHGKKIVGDLSK